ncbi:glycosyltransferase [Planomonospora sp. ID67723]|uniref:glycosyltransferase family 2 protein n=1 Tax=Planomonospora sp. ID67723 TaxID=2738134 RepID=UPI0018C390F3|nr:glycosyltransferase family 2 protein [Planomonospora sp. ID67723]MBG0828306.1 glycosyltransferase [Planomonospora sp. ID67723]
MTERPPLTGPPGPGLPAAGRLPAAGGQPRVRLNDHGSLTPPELGCWTPSRTVSVVIPAYRCQETLDLTLAALAGQSYPAHLTEVIVVDDGGGPALRLGEIRPENTRIIPSRPGGWGRAWACQTGADAAGGEVIHWLDADMVPFREHVEAQLRWHHLADYLVVLGSLKFVDLAAGLPSPREVHEAVAGDWAEKLLDQNATEPHGWVEEFLARTDDLRDCPIDAYNVHCGATASVTARLLRAAGGMDTSLVLGEDTELGYRLSQRGAVFVPEARARSRHLGLHTVGTREAEVKRHNWPLLAERVPELRWLRTHPSRRRLVPYVDVVVNAAGARYEDVRATVDGVLASTLPDVAVTLAGPWSTLTSHRRSPLDDPLLDLRLARATYEHDGRVSFAEEPGEDSAPAMFRFLLPAGWVPGPDSLRRLTADADTDCAGVVDVVLDGHDDLVTARLERTAAMTRARLLAAEGEALDDVVHVTFGVRWTSGEMWDFLPASAAAKPSTSRSNAETDRLRGEAARWKAEAARWKAEAAGHREEAARWKAEASRWRRSAVQWRRELAQLRRLRHRWRRKLTERAPFLRAVGRTVRRSRITDDG